MAEYKGILVCGELADGKLASITTELLGCGRKLADSLQESLSCLLTSDAIGDGRTSCPQRISSRFPYTSR